MNNFNWPKVIKDINKAYLNKDIDTLIYINAYVTSVLDETRNELINLLSAWGSTNAYVDLRNTIAYLNSIKDKINKLIDQLGRAWYFTTNFNSHEKEKEE